MDLKLTNMTLWSAFDHNVDQGIAVSTPLTRSIREGKVKWQLNAVTVMFNTYWQYWQQNRTCSAGKLGSIRFLHRTSSIAPSDSSWSKVRSTIAATDNVGHSMLPRTISPKKLKFPYEHRCTINSAIVHKDYHECHYRVGKSIGHATLARHLVVIHCLEETAINSFQWSHFPCCHVCTIRTVVI